MPYYLKIAMKKRFGQKKTTRTFAISLVTKIMYVKRPMLRKTRARQQYRMRSKILNIEKKYMNTLQMLSILHYHSILLTVEKFCEGNY